MSDEDERGPERPMLILGQDYPDVEDTTPEELRRQEQRAREEIERKRREAQEEIERKRREAEREIAELEKQKARELRERERELEQTQKKLYDRETKLLRKARATSGQKPARVVQRPPSRPLRYTGLRSHGFAVLLAFLAAGGIVLGGLTGGSSIGEETLAEVDSLDQARVHYLRAALEIDEAMAARMAGEPGAAGSVPGSSSIEEALALASESDYYGSRTLEQAEGMVDESIGTVRSLTLWEEASTGATYAVAAYEVEDLYEDDLTWSVGSIVWVSIGLAALLALIVMAVLARSWVSVALLVLGAGLAISLYPVLAGGPTRTAIEAAENHRAADDVVDDIVDQVHDDLTVVYGTSRSSLSRRADYWDTEAYYYSLEPEGDPHLTAYFEAREAVGEAEGEEESYAAAIGLVAAGREAFEAHVSGLEQARGEMLRAMDDLPSPVLPTMLGLGGGVLVVAGLLLSRGPRGRSS